MFWGKPTEFVLVRHRDRECRVGLVQNHAHWTRVLLIIDGESSDIDVHDPQYLVFDVRKAVEENHRRGIYTCCMSLGPKADGYVSRVFDIRKWTVVDHIRRLPEMLPYLYVRFTP